MRSKFNIQPFKTLAVEEVFDSFTGQVFRQLSPVTDVRST